MKKRKNGCHSVISMRDLSTHLSSCPHATTENGWYKRAKQLETKNQALMTRINQAETKISNLEQEIIDSKENLTHNSFDICSYFFQSNQLDAFSRYLVHLEADPHFSKRNRIYQNVMQIYRRWQSGKIQYNYPVLQILSLALNQMRFTDNQDRILRNALVDVVNSVQEYEQSVQENEGYYSSDSSWSY